MLPTLMIKVMSGFKAKVGYFSQVCWIKMRNVNACKSSTSLKKGSVLEFISVTLVRFLHAVLNLLALIPRNLFLKYKKV